MSFKKNKVSDKVCYIISEDSNYDTKTLDFKEAWIKAVGFGMGTILVFGDAQVIYYEGEYKFRYLSKFVS